MFDQLQRASIFLKIDLQSGYHRLRIREVDIRKTTFRTCYRHYEFALMLFHLTNASTAFMNLMNWVFNDYLKKFIMMFMDSIDLLTNKRREC